MSLPIIKSMLNSGCTKLLPTLVSQSSQGSISQDSTTKIIIQLSILAFTVGVMIFVCLYRGCLKKRRIRSIFDFSQYEEYHRVQSAESNQSSENYSPAKFEEPSQEEANEPLMNRTALGGKLNFKSEGRFSKFSDVST